MTDLRDSIFVAFDTETTGLVARESHVIEIAGVRLTGHGVEIGRFSTLANPGVAIDPAATRIHGIDDGMVASAPGSVEACRQFVEWLGESDILVAHHAAFDVTFISTELARGRHGCPRNTVADSRLLMKDLTPEVADFRLKTLVEHFRLPDYGYHRAMADSLHVMALLLEYLDARPEVTRSAMLRVAGVDGLFDMTSGQMNGRPRYAHITELIEKGEILRIRYDSESRGCVERRILPLNLCHIGGADHLVAQCMTDGSIKQFRLDRVIDLSESRRNEQARRMH